MRLLASLSTFRRADRAPRPTEVMVSTHYTGTDALLRARTRGLGESLPHLAVTVRGAATAMGHDTEVSIILMEAYNYFCAVPNQLLVLMTRAKGHLILWATRAAQERPGGAVVGFVLSSLSVLGAHNAWQVAPGNRKEAQRHICQWEQSLPETCDWQSSEACYPLVAQHAEFAPQLPDLLPWQMCVSRGRVSCG